MLEDNKIYVNAGGHLYMRRDNKFFELRFQWQDECYPGNWTEVSEDTVDMAEWVYGVKLEPLSHDNITKGMYVEDSIIKRYRRSVNDY